MAEFEIQEKIIEFCDQVFDYHTNINNEGVWLYLATLGCWSVSHPDIRLTAIFMAAAMFFYLFVSKLKYKKSFSRTEADIKSDIESTIFEPGRKEHYFSEIEEVKREINSITVFIKKIPIFTGAFIFWGITIFYVVMHSPEI